MDLATVQAMTDTTTTTQGRGRKAPATTTIPEPVVSDWHAARARKAAERAANGETTRERRNETRHPDGAAAVDFTSCPTCKARKGEQCFKANGTDRTPYVHGTRMAKWDNS